MKQALPQQQPGDEPIINIRGEKVCLGPAHRGVISVFAKWDNDFEVTVLAGDPLRPKTMEQIEADFNSFSKSDARWAPFVIYEAATMRLIGATDLRHIDGEHRSAEFGISIGEKDCWGKGYGTETVILMLDYGFSVLGLHNIMLDTYSYNERAIRAYTRAGFREIGRRREAKRIGGQVYDVVYMDCLATEFHSPLKPVVPQPKLEPLSE